MSRPADSPSSTPASDAASSGDNAATPAVTPSAANAAPAQPSVQTTQRPPRLALLIATGFGLGYLPKAPGTWGSLLGLALAWGFRKHELYSLFVHRPYVHFAGYELDSWVFYGILIVIGVALLGVWTSQRVANFWGERDPQRVVIDEISGQMIALLGAGWILSHSSDVIIDPPRFIALMAPSWQYLLAGFILFRVFDIWKPWPVRQAEKLPGGWGIMADDWVAGIYAALCLWGLRAAGL